MFIPWQLEFSVAVLLVDGANAGAWDSAGVQCRRFDFNGSSFRGSWSTVLLHFSSVASLPVLEFQRVVKELRCQLGFEREFMPRQLELPDAAPRRLRQCRGLGFS